jgi:hypothetical protein
LWRTPDAGCARGAQSEERFAESQEKHRLLTLNDQVAHLFPTPRAASGMSSPVRDPEKVGRHRSRLEDYIALFPTPTLHGNYNRRGASRKSGDGLATAAGGSLNPEWVEVLMGFPRYWTDLNWEDQRVKEIAPGHNGWPDGSWESGIPRIARGVKDRVARLRALGNAVVPDQARVVFQAVMDAERREAG